LDGDKNTFIADANVNTDRYSDQNSNLDAIPHVCADEHSYGYADRYSDQNGNLDAIPHVYADEHSYGYADCHKYTNANSNQSTNDYGNANYHGKPEEFVFTVGSQAMTWLWSQSVSAVRRHGWHFSLGSGVGQGGA
jgi:hypothetical protein